MKLEITEEWFRKRSSEEGELEVGVGFSLVPLTPPAFNNCTCSCHRGSGLIHFVACCAPAHPITPDEVKLRRSKALDELGALDGELMK